MLDENYRIEESIKTRYKLSKYNIKLLTAPANRHFFHYRLPINDYQLSQNSLPKSQPYNPIPPCRIGNGIVLKAERKKGFVR